MQTVHEYVEDFKCKVNKDLAQYLPKFDGTLQPGSIERVQAFTEDIMIKAKAFDVFMMDHANQIIDQAKAHSFTDIKGLKHALQDEGLIFFTQYKKNCNTPFMHSAEA